MQLDPRNWNRTALKDAANIPCKPGCYCFLDANDNILYIGRSKMLWNRLRQPLRHQGMKRLQQNVESVTITWCCGWDVYDSEKVLIQKWNPPLCQDHIRRKG